MNRKWFYAWCNPYRWGIGLNFDWVPIENILVIQLDVLCFSVEIDAPIGRLFGKGY